MYMYWYVVAFFKEIKSRFLRKYNTIKIHKWKINGSNKLVVFIHGVNSSPLSWSEYFKHEPSYDYFVPNVYKKGNCSIEKASHPILNDVQNYVERYPNNYIILVGHSNGARIATYVEQNLVAKNICLVSIAGPHHGTKLVNLAKWCGITKYLNFSCKLLDELTYDGNGRCKFKNTTIKHFFASKNDMRVFPNDTSLPLEQNSTYYLIHGESHVTIIDSVKNEVLCIINAL
jgi:hypothetical protein